MPYSSIGELPEVVRMALTEEAQEIFLAAYSAVISRNPGDGSWAMRAGWDAVGRQFQKGSDGLWHAILENKGGMQALYSKAEHLNAKHATILQTLDCQVGDTFFDAKWFEPTVADWQKAPIIYVPKGMGHPDLDAYDEDPEAALAAVQGRIIDGAFIDPSIAVAGHPRLVGTSNVKDKEIDALIAKGVLSLSTAFRAMVKDGHLAGPVQPHHILIFEEDEANQPRDRGSGFLNKEGTMNADDKGHFEWLKMKLGFAAGGTSDQRKEEEDMADKELEQKLAAATTEAADLKNKLAAKETELTNKGEQLKAKDDEITALKAKLESFETAKRNADWEAVKCKLPKGMVHGEEEAKSRKMFEEQPAAFAQKVLDLKLKGNTLLEGDETLGEPKVARVGGMKWDNQLNKFVWE